MDGTEPTVYVVDDDDAVSSSLSWLLESIGLRVRTYRNALDFIAAMDADPWGCLVLDVRMPGMSGLELQQRLRDRDVGLPVIFITGHGGVANAVKAIKAGAFDFLEKPFDDQTLLDRVQQAIGVNSETRRCRSARAALLDRYASLTPREREVMDLVVEGRPNKVIAQVLGLSSKTVEAHRAHVMEKMAARSLTELVKQSLCIQSPDAGWIGTGTSMPQGRAGNPLAEQGIERISASRAARP